jgi:hypothetical protein
MMFGFDAITFDPPFGAPVILGLGAVLAALAIVVYRQSWRGLAGGGRIRAAFLLLLRLAAIAGLVVVLMRPMTLRSREVRTVYPVFSLLVDNSASMKTEDIEGKARKTAVAETMKSAGADFSRAMSEKYLLKAYEFSDRLQPSAIEKIAEAGETMPGETDLGAALMNAANAASGQRQIGMLLISDGRANSGAGAAGVSEAARYLRSQKVPVWTVSLGTAVETKDLYVTARLNQNYLFARQPGLVKVSVSQSGFENWYAKVNLYREGEYVTSQQVMLKGGGAQIDFPVREEARGLYKYTVEVENLPGEADQANNKRSIFARVVDSKTQVLVVEARP